MAKIDSATLVVGAGNYYTAPVGTALPDPLTTVTTPWENMGHTSLEDIFSMSSEGGEASVLGTLQNKNLRTRYSDRTEAIAITLQQFDEKSLKLFYGANAINVNGLIAPHKSPVPTQAAFLAVFLDGDNVFAIYIPKAEIYRGDDLSISDTESLAGLPLSVRPLQLDENDYTFAVTPIGKVLP